MKQKLVTIVTGGGPAQKLGAVLSRLFGLVVEIHNPGSMVRLVDRLLEHDPDMVVYSWNGDERHLVDWLKGQGLQTDAVRLTILTYKGFGVSQMATIDRLITRRGGARRLAYVA